MDDQEQILLGLEQRHLSLKREHDAVCQERDVLKVKLNSLEKSFDNSKETIEKLQKETYAKDSEIKKRELEMKELNQLNEDLNDRLKCRNNEVERLKEDLKSQSEELQLVRNRYRDQQIQYAETQSQILPFQFEITKFTREVEVYKSRIEDLENDIQVLSKENNIYKRDLNNQQYTYESSLAEYKATIDENKRKIHSLQDLITNRDAEISNYATRIKDLEYRLADQESSYIQEIDSLKKMASMYKRHLDDSLQRIDELESTATGAKNNLHTQLIQIKEKYQREIDGISSKLMEEKEGYERQIQILEQKVLSYEQQFSTNVTSGNTLHRAIIPNDTQEDSTTRRASMNSTSNSLIVPPDFFTLSTTEMYDRIVSAENERLQEINRRQEIEMYLDRVLKDIETKAPLIASQKRDYTRVLYAHETLSKQLEELSYEYQKMKEMNKMIEKKALESNEEMMLYKQQNIDLSRQLQHLLKKFYELQSLSSSSPQGVSSQSLGSAASRGRLSLNASKSSVALIENESSSMDIASPALGTIGMIGGITSSDDVISNYLVIYDDIQELQTRNQQLLQVVRKLSSEQEKSWAPQEDDQKLKDVTDALNEAMVELSALKEARQRTEDMVVGLIQQRDMYKAMVEELHITQGLIKKSTTPGGASTAVMETFKTPVRTHESAGLFSPTSGGSTSSQLFKGTSGGNTTTTNMNDIQLQVAILEEENKRLKDRSVRIDEVEKLLNQSIDNLKQDNMTLRMEATRATSEATFQKERSDRLEESMKIIQLELSTTLQRRLDVEKELLELQKISRNKDDTIFEYTQQIKSLDDNIKRLQVDIEVKTTNESRLLQQIFEQKEEIKRQVTLTESIQRIESGLISRLEEEKIAINHEKDQVVKQLDSIRKQMNQKELIDDQKIRLLQEELKSTQSQLYEKTTVLNTIQQDYIREQMTSSAAQDRAALLEKQLTIVNDRLASIHGANTLESILHNTIAEKEMTIDKLTNDINMLQSKLQIAESHAEQFRLISVATEKSFKESQELSANNKKTFDEEVTKLQNVITNLQDSTITQKTSLTAALQEVEEVREQNRLQASEFSTKIKEQEDKYAELDLKYQETISQLDVLKADVIKYQEAAKMSYDNYERELQLHASAEKKVRTIQESYDVLKQEVTIEKDRYTQLSVDMIRKESQYTEEKSKLESICKGYKEEVESLRHTNDLLHGQVQALGAQVDRLLESKATSALTSSTEGLTTSSSSSSSSTTGGTLSTGMVEELNELRTNLSETREVIRYIKRERDLIEAKLAVSDTENNRYQQQVIMIQKQLDETKIELKKEIEKKTVTRSEEEFSRLMTEVTQLNLLRESNAHLRYENEELSKRVHTIQQELNTQKINNRPLIDEIRTLKAEKEALEVNKKALMEESSYWRERLNQFVVKFNDVDPEEHRLLLDKCTKLEADKNEIEVKLSTLTQQHQDTIAAKDKELSALRTTYETLDRNSGLLRQKLRDFKTKYDEQTKKLTDSTKTVTDLTTDIAKVTNELRVTKAAVITAEETIKSLKESHEVALAAAVTSASAVGPMTSTGTTTAITTGVSASTAAAPHPPMTPAPTPIRPSQPISTPITTPIPPSGPPPTPSTAITTIEDESTTTITTIAPVPAATNKLSDMKRLLMMKTKQKEASNNNNVPTSTPAPASIDTAHVTTSSSSAVEESSTSQVTKKARGEDSSGITTSIPSANIPASTMSDLPRKTSTMSALTTTPVESSEDIPGLLNVSSDNLTSSPIAPTITATTTTTTTTAKGFGMMSTNKTSQLNTFALPFTANVPSLSVPTPLTSEHTGLFDDLIPSSSSSSFEQESSLNSPTLYRQDTIPMEEEQQQQQQMMLEVSELFDDRNKSNLEFSMIEENEPSLVPETESSSFQPIFNTIAMTTTTGSDTTTTTTNTNKGPFLNLRPPSPIANKDLTPVFGTKKQLTFTSLPSAVSGDVPSLLQPITSTTTGYKTNIAQFVKGLTSSTTTATSTATGGSSLFGTTNTLNTSTTATTDTSAVQPIVMGSSIFGNTTNSSTTNEPNTISASTTTTSNPFAQTGATPKFASNPFKTITSGATVNPFGTPSPQFGAASTTSGGTTGFGTSTSSTSPFGFFGALKSTPTATSDTTTATTTATTSGTEVHESGEGSINVPTTSVTTSTSAEVEAQSVVKLAGQSNVLSIEEQKRRRLEKFQQATAAANAAAGVSTTTTTTTTTNTSITTSSTAPPPPPPVSAVSQSTIPPTTTTVVNPPPPQGAPPKVVRTRKVAGRGAGGRGPGKAGTASAVKDSTASSGDNTNPSADNSGNDNQQA